MSTRTEITTEQTAEFEKNIGENFHGFTATLYVFTDDEGQKWSVFGGGYRNNAEKSFKDTVIKNIVSRDPDLTPNGEEVAIDASYRPTHVSLADLLDILNFGISIYYYRKET